MKYLVLVLLSYFLLPGAIHCQDTEKKPVDTFALNTLTFYSSRCKGPCPDITLQVDGAKNIQLIRRMFDNRGMTDTISSGSFMGKLSDKQYNKMVELLRKINWDTVVFPDNTCCDGTVVSIILSYNNTSKRFRSMSPPKETYALIDYLHDLAVNISLPACTKPMDFIRYDLPAPINQ